MFSEAKVLPQEDIPDALYEHLFASEYGWTLEYIEALPLRKFREHAIVLVLKKAIEAARASARL